MKKVEVGRLWSPGGFKPVYLHLQEEGRLEKMNHLRKYIRGVRDVYFVLLSGKEYLESVVVIKEWIDMAFKVLNKRNEA